MIKLYTPAPLEGVEFTVFQFKFAPEMQGRGVFDEDPFPNFFQYGVEYVDSMSAAKAVILPNNFKILDEKSRAYIQKYVDEAAKVGIPVFVFSFGDLNHNEHFDMGVRVFRLSTYRSVMKPNDIIIPTTSRDFASEGIHPRLKAAIPVVSFCGQAGFKTARQWIIYFIKNSVWNTRSIVDPIYTARKQGVFWRRVLIRALKSSPLVKTNFIIRHSFSGAFRTIELPPAQARREFIQSITDADFVLAPKGDGNYSNRFLETLSLGRIPVLVDTDAVLPLENIIDYTQFVVTVPMRNVSKTAKYIREFYDPLTLEEWQKRQHLAHDTFQKYLRQDSFFKYYFEQLLDATLPESVN